MDSAQSQGTEASQASVPLRDLAAHFLRYLELRPQFFGLEFSRDGFFRFKIVKPHFPATFAEFRRDRECLEYPDEKPLQLAQNSASK
jgi:hypothetical protein